MSLMIRDGLNHLALWILFRLTGAHQITFSYWHSSVSMQNPYDEKCPTCQSIDRCVIFAEQGCDWTSLYHPWHDLSGVMHKVTMDPP